MPVFVDWGLARLFLLRVLARVTQISWRKACISQKKWTRIFSQFPMHMWFVFVFHFNFQGARAFNVLVFVRKLAFPFAFPGISLFSGMLASWVDFLECNKKHIFSFSLFYWNMFLTTPLHTLDRLWCCLKGGQSQICTNSELMSVK